MYKKTILIDLDGVLNEYTGNYDPDYIPPIRSGAFELLENLSGKYDLRIFTTRNRKLVEKWLFSYKIQGFIKSITNEKVPAWLIIDDRCIKFSGSYHDLLNQIENFKPWYK